MTSSVIRRFSTIATDPLRNFRFYAEFTAAGDTNSQQPFTSKIITTADTNMPANGTSSGWIGGFTYINGLNVNVQPIQYREGGYNTTVHQMPGMATFSPITMQRGVMYGNDQALAWMRGLFSTTSAGGLSTAGKNFRVNVKVFVMDHPNNSGNAGTANVADDNTPRMGFEIHNAWISALSYTDLNAASNELMFETITLVHEGLSVFFTDSNFNPITITA